MCEELEQSEENQEQPDGNQEQLIEIYKLLKCQRLFRPLFRKFNPSFVARIP